MSVPERPKPPFQTDDFLAALLWNGADEAGKEVLANANRYQLQIMYIRIDRDAAGKPSFTRYRYHEHPGTYFYPASTVKLPIALTALEKLHLIGRKGLTKHTPMITGGPLPGSPLVSTDATAPGGRPTVAHYIRKMLLVSDNDAANRLYEFTGQEALNRTLHAKGYGNTDILHRLDSQLTEEQNRRTYPVTFRRGDHDDHELYFQAGTYNTAPYPARHDLLESPSFESVTCPSGEDRGEILDFSAKNRAPLGELLRMLQSVLFPASVEQAARFTLTGTDLRFLYQCLSEHPTESRYPRYDPEKFPPYYSKFLLFGGGTSSNIPSSVRSFGKSGWAFGFLTDVAYICDFSKGVEFMLAATMQTGVDDTLKTDGYAYDRTGKPFMAAVGRTLYQYELSRPRKYIPSLSRYSLFLRGGNKNRK
jgi:hypothetical protein